jgi:transposase
MSQKEAFRLHVMNLLFNKDITQKKAREMMGLSKSQTIRIKKSYLQFGIKGLISKRRGNPSPNKISNEILSKAASIITEKYFDFGPTFAREKLIEKHNINMSKETVRKLMIKEGLWKDRKHKHVIVHQRRARRARFGSLIQIDGSPHLWFENRAEKCCLIVFIDDATSIITAARFCDNETTDNYLDTLKIHINKYGKPLSFYSDKHQIFKVNNKKHFTGREITHFGSVLKNLDIDLICANSPQVKGRVERANGVLQDRLIKEMRLNNISSIEEGNIFLEKYLQKHNAKFAKNPLCSEDAHRPINVNLDIIFAKKEQRKLSKDLTFNYGGILYQINKQIATYSMKRSIITVIDNRGDITIDYKGQKLDYKKYSEVEYQATVVDKKSIDAWINKKTRKASRNHPWR